MFGILKGWKQPLVESISIKDTMSNRVSYVPGSRKSRILWNPNGWCIIICLGNYEAAPQLRFIPNFRTRKKEQNLLLNYITLQYSRTRQEFNNLAVETIARDVSQSVSLQQQERIQSWQQQWCSGKVASWSSPTEVEDSTAMGQYGCSKRFILQLHSQHSSMMDSATESHINCKRDPPYRYNKLLQ
jgi:hypothetical protein